MFMEHGQCTAASAFKLQFHGLVHSSMHKIVWKAWASPKIKNHTKIGFGWPIDYKIVVGQIMVCVRFESKHLSWLITFLSIIGSTLDFWDLLKKWFDLHGIHPRQSPSAFKLQFHGLVHSSMDCFEGRMLDGGSG
jgi:hypothetical protein